MGTQVVILTGNLGKDAEMRFTPTGTAILNFSLPIDIGFGEKKETMWVRCAMFGDRAQKLAEHLTKGKGVQVVGEFRMPTIYEGKNGNTVNMDFNVNQLSFVGGAKSADDGGAHNNGNGAPVAAGQSEESLIPF